jgi:hypothetical protein
MLQTHGGGARAAAPANGGGGGASSLRNDDGGDEGLVVFQNTWEYDHYLPRRGPPVPHHWCDETPTFSYLDHDSVARRRAEVQRRELSGAAPHPYSAIAFPAHPTRTDALAMSSTASASLTSVADDDDDDGSDRPHVFAGASPQQLNTMTQAWSSGADERSEPAATPTSAASGLTAETASLTAAQRRTRIAAQRLRHAQIVHGTVGAIFQNAPRRRQLRRAAADKQLARGSDKHVPDERFFQSRIAPAAEAVLAVERALNQVRPRTPEQIARAQRGLPQDQRQVFGSPQHRALREPWHQRERSGAQHQQQAGDDRAAPPEAAAFQRGTRR